MIKNITLSADENLIKKARKKAQEENTSLNAKFRKWLEEYITSEKRAIEYKKLMKKLKYVNAGRKFTREEMNER